LEPSTLQIETTNRQTGSFETWAPVGGKRLAPIPRLTCHLQSASAEKYERIRLPGKLNWKPNRVGAAQSIAGCLAMSR
jgi:hypothetical protein